MSTPTPTRPGVAGAVSSAIASAAPDAPPREEDPRTRAARRAQELRDHNGGAMDEGTDKYFIPPNLIPDGWSYEWKRLTVFGKEDPSYQVSLAVRGWEPVPRSRHPQLMPDTYRGETIERDGQILMERPLEITQEVQVQDKRRAREQVKFKEEQLNGAPAGQFERDKHPQTRANINKSFQSIPIPDK